MRLSAALRLADGDIAAFVGGGGKTTAMFRLAGELAAEGKHVITTTTTRLGAGQTTLAPAVVMLEPGGVGPEQRAEILALLERHRHVLVVRAIDPTLDKASGVDAALIAPLARLPGVSAVLVEADGSREKPFKAPAQYEPVIASETTLVVPVVGADVLGRPLAPLWVHRPDRITALTGAPEGAPVTPSLVAQVLAHPQGGLKNAPPGARVLPLINKVETPAQEQAALETAEQLLALRCCEAVLIGAVEKGNPVQRVRGRVAAVVPAAGRSLRMGVPKHVLPWGAGETVIGRIVGQLAKSGVADIVVVTGGAREQVEAAVAHAAAAVSGLPVRCVYNPDFATREMLSSLQAGLRSLSPDVAAALVALGDQPQIDPAVAQAVAKRWGETRAEAVFPVFEGRRGHPVLFDRGLWPALLALPDTATPRDLLSTARVEVVPVETRSILDDIDTRADYEREKPDDRFSEVR
jgi:molybdenum cofactor cytidylyltransferase